MVNRRRRPNQRHGGAVKILTGRMKGVFAPIVFVLPAGLAGLSRLILTLVRARVTQFKTRRKQDVAGLVLNGHHT